MISTVWSRGLCFGKPVQAVPRMSRTRYDIDDMVMHDVYDEVLIAYVNATMNK